MDAGGKCLSDKEIPLPAVAIHPGSGGAAKCWPLENYLDLADRIRGRGLAVVFILGPVEQDLWAEDGRIEQLADWPVITDASISVLAGLLAQAAGFVGNDSGPAHLAGAAGTPTLALFGPTNPTQFAPLGPRVVTLVDAGLSAIEPRVAFDTLMGMISR
jgi:heptosyltransferase-2/heptosyltransferase-3